MLHVFAVALACGVAWGQVESLVPHEGWDVEYNAETLPQEARRKWSGKAAENTRAEVTPEGLRLVDAGTQPTQLYCFTRRWEALPETGGVVEARAKVVSCTSRSGICIFAADGRREAAVTLFPDRKYVHQEDVEHEMDLTDDFHTIRLEIKGEDFLVFADDRLAIDGRGKLTRPAYRGRCCVMFGSISSASTGEATFKQVRYFAAKEEVERLPGAEDIIIYKQEGIYGCFPSLRRGEDGRLYTSFGTRVRASHIDNTGGTAKRVSADGGRTWQETDDFPRAAYERAADGSLALGYARGWTYVPEEKREELEAQGFEVRAVREGTVAYCPGALWRRSTDGGETWERGEIETPKLALMMSGTQASFLRTKDGVRLTGVYGKQTPDGTYTAYALRSEDDGRTWGCVTMAEGTEELGFNEPALLETRDGRIIAMFRTNPRGSGRLYQSESTDRGKTWSEPVDTGIWGYPPHLLQLQSGDILCSYGYRRGAMGVRAVLSHDDGRTWDKDNTIVLRCDGVGNPGDLGYPVSIEVEPGVILTVYYITCADGITHVAATRWAARISG